MIPEFPTIKRLHISQFRRALITCFPPQRCYLLRLPSDRVGRKVNIIPAVLIYGIEVIAGLAGLDKTPHIWVPG